MPLVSLAVRVLVLTLLAQISTSSHAQQTSEPANTKVVPTLEALPHIPLSKGKFAGWCGQKDRYLIVVDRQFEAYDAGVKSATIAVSSDWQWQCRNDGEKFIYLDSNMGYVTAVDIASGDSRLLASYPPNPSITLSFSPDFKSVAASKPLTLTADAAGLKVIDVSREQTAEQIAWSSDGSAFYLAHHFTELETFDARGRKLHAVKRPSSEIVEGWFNRDRRILTFFLTRNQRQDVGSAIRCPLASGKCVPLKSRVESLSIGGRDIMGVVEPLDRPTPDVDDSKTIYARYGAEIRHPKAGLLARQTFRTAHRRRDYAISISPSGTRAILTWHDNVGCEAGAGSDGCARGILINLPEVNE